MGTRGHCGARCRGLPPRLFVPCSSSACPAHVRSVRRAYAQRARNVPARCSPRASSYGWGRIRRPQRPQAATPGTYSTTRRPQPGQRNVVPGLSVVLAGSNRASCCRAAATAYTSHKAGCRADTVARRSAAWSASVVAATTARTASRFSATGSSQSRRSSSSAHTPPCSRSRGR